MAVPPALPTDTAFPAAAEAPQQPEISEEQRRKLASASKMLAAAFGEIISLLMRTPNYKHLSLADLEWLVVPAISAGQFSIAEAQSKANGMTQPMGAVLWARVSADVDKRLNENLDQPMRLTPQEWTSGDILWLIEATGEPRVIEGLLKHMRQTVWAGKTVRVRARDKDGKPAVGNLAPISPASGSAQV